MSRKSFLNEQDVVPGCSQYIQYWIKWPQKEHVASKWRLFRSCRAKQCRLTIKQLSRRVALMYNYVEWANHKRLLNKERMCGKQQLIRPAGIKMQTSVNDFLRALWRTLLPWGCLLPPGNNSAWRMFIKKKNSSSFSRFYKCTSLYWGYLVYSLGNYRRMNMK